jgi:uncharacterized protein (TIGR03437 family)
LETARKVLLGFVLIAGALAAQNPSFTGVVNAGSNLPPGFPNSGLAQGCIFVVYGSNLGPSSLVQATGTTLPTSAGLAGTVITITVGGSTVVAPLIYTYTGQVAAVLPSTTPEGNGTLILTYNGKSAATPVTVVASNFGIVTDNNSGAGPAVVTFGNYQPVTTTNSAAPGDELVLWGTGLGALPAGQSDAVGAEGPLALPPFIAVFVGGQSAAIKYSARTPTAIGLDQINFLVPLNAPLGCNVPILVQTTFPTATVSNGPTMSLASTDGAPCADPTQVAPSSLSNRSSVKAAFVQLKQTANLNVTPTGTSTSASQKATAAFFQFSQSQYAAFAPTANTEPALGSCLTGVVQGSGTSSSGLPTATFLSGGASVSLTPPSFPAIVLSQFISGPEILYQNTSFTTAMPSGTWGYSNTGGDVGALNFTFPVAAQVNWANELQLATGAAIDHTQPLTITWTGGDANGYVDIQGTGQIGTGTGFGFVAGYTYYFDCSAPTSAGKFSIPPSALGGMPLGTNAYANIQVSTYQFPLSTIPVTGFDAFIVNAEYQVNAPVVFK